MKREFWTLLCRDQNVKPYTKKYPYWYANVLARSLAPYGIPLNVLTDDFREVLGAAARAGVENLIPYPIRDDMIAGMKFRPLGWWNKLLFYNHAFPLETLFVDLDSIFIADPEPIFQFIEGTEHQLIMERAVFSWNLIRTTVASPLVYIDHSGTLAYKIWRRFAALSGIPRRDDPKYQPVRMRGDQDFVEWALQGIFGNEHALRDGAVGRWPMHFYGRYKVITRAPGWEAPSTHYRGLTLDQFISIAFNGRPKIEDIVKGRMEGWTLFRNFISEAEADEIGFRDPNARG